MSPRPAFANRRVMLANIIDRRTDMTEGRAVRVTLEPLFDLADGMGAEAETRQCSLNEAARWAMTSPFAAVLTLEDPAKPAAA